jgi:hypothetical protein
MVDNGDSLLGMILRHFSTPPELVESFKSFSWSNADYRTEPLVDENGVPWVADRFTVTAGEDWKLDVRVTLRRIDD